MKYFILDTNVFLHDPTAITKFHKNTLIIPITVIEEIDNFKKDQSDLGRNAREFSRVIDRLRARGSLSTGVDMDNNSRLIVELDSTALSSKLPTELHPEKADNRILSVAYKYLEEHGREKVVFVTKDTNLRIKADALGIPSEDYESRDVKFEELYTGITVLEVTEKEISEFYSAKILNLTDSELKPNQYVVLRDQLNPSLSAIARYDYRQSALVPLIPIGEGVWGLTPKNVEQTFALDLLLNDDVQLVSLVGKAGTGKTLLAIAAGMHKTLDEGKYQRLLVSRPIFPMGKDVGYLPGDLEQKLNPWMQPIFDNIEFLMGGSDGSNGVTRGTQELINQGMLNIEPLTYIRGRSIPNQIMIVDEAQNLTPHEMKTILTRAGENSKIILTGDCQQIDNPYVDSASNGLAHVVERFKDEEIAGNVTLIKGERSPLAELASNVL